MKNKGKILIAQALAGILAFSFVGTACISNETYEETGTTVKFDYNDGSSRPYSVIADEGETIAMPTTPIREGYEFSHWQTEKDGGTEVSFPYSPTDDVTFYAAWTPKQYKVIFDMNYNNDTDIEKSVTYGATVEAPTPAEIPTRNGYEFFAWQNKAEDGTTISFPYTVKKDTTFYAIWASGGIYKLSFDVNYEGGETFEEVSVIAGKKIQKKETPTPKRDGYIFKGWSTSETASDIIEFPYAPTGSETLYAIWEKATYIVTYKYNVINGESAGFAQFKGLYYGDDIPQPAGEPTRPGHTFAGWYTTSQGGELVDFTKKVERTTNYYAHWITDAVTTDTFQAEFTEFDPLEEFPGYSGAANGAGTITPENVNITGLIYDADYYPTNEIKQEVIGHFVTYLYKPGATLTFKIYASEAVNGATLQANLATEFVTNVTIAPTGDYAWKLKVNDEEINYTPFTMNNTLNTVSNASPFTLYTLANINLKKGENVIQLITYNNTPAIGGTTSAFAPMVDCIKIINTGSVALSYHPIYDNLWFKSLT